MATEKTLSASERAQLFAMSTRQNLQMMSKQTATAEGATLEFTLPKARLLARILCRVTVKVNVTHASGTALTLTDKYAPMKLIRKWALDLNNGFTPFNVTGEQLAYYNMCDYAGSAVRPQTSNEQGYNYVPTLTASSSGTSNTLAFTVELPVTLSKSQPVGLILLQNQETSVNLRADIGTMAEAFGTISGYTLALESIEINPMVETFSIPASATAYPDLSCLKIVQGRKDTLPSAGQQVIKLTTGQIYRKIFFSLRDASDEMTDTEITSNIELVFNQSDINYSINPTLLRQENERQLGFPLPKGVYMIDFSGAGNIPNFGGTRDYIDSSNLVEMWLRFTTENAGSCVLVTETISRLTA